VGADTPEAVTLVADTHPEGTLPAAILEKAKREDTSAGCAPYSESILIETWDRPLQIFRPVLQRTSGTFRHRPGGPLACTFRRRCSGLRRHIHSVLTAKFLSALQGCGIIAISSSDAFHGFRPRDASGMAPPKSASLNRCCRYFASVAILARLTLALASPMMRLTRATASIPSDRCSRRCRRSLPLICRVMIEQNGIPRRAPELYSPERLKTRARGKACSYWC